MQIIFLKIDPFGRPTVIPAMLPFFLAILKIYFSQVSVVVAFWTFFTVPKRFSLRWVLSLGNKNKTRGQVKAVRRLGKRWDLFFPTQKKESQHFPNHRRKFSFKKSFPLLLAQNTYNKTCLKLNHTVPQFYWILSSLYLLYKNEN